MAFRRTMTVQARHDVRSEEETLPLEPVPAVGLENRPARATTRRESSGHRLRIAMMPRCKGAQYSACCREGAQEAARELDAELVWDAPNEPDPTAQVDILQTWLDSRFDVIAVAASDPHSVSCVLRAAQARGTPIVAWDSDTEPDARSIFVSPIEADVTSRILADEAADLVDGHGDIAVLAYKCDDAFEAFRMRLLEKRPDLTLCAVRFGADEGERAFSFTRDMMRFCPSLRLVVSLSPLSIRGAAAAVSLSGRENVNVIGVGLPASGGPHVGAGVTPITIHWNPQDLGYLTVYAAASLGRRQLELDARSLPAGRLGERDLRGSEVVLGRPVVARRGGI